MIYVWKSDFMSDYTDGHGYIVIEADDIKESRQKAYEYFLKEYILSDNYVSKSYINGYMEDFHGKILVSYRKRFLNDINKEPEIKDHIFIIDSIEKSA